MKSQKPTIAIIGSGPAALSSAFHLTKLLHGDADITMFHMGHHFGGKAASWESPAGNFEEHGFHICFTFYTEMFAMMQEVGISLDEILKKVEQQVIIHNDRSNPEQYALTRSSVDSYWSMFWGLALAPLKGNFIDTMSFYRMMINVIALILSDADLSLYDDMCFSAFAYQWGLKSKAVDDLTLMRFFKQAYFNWPEEISAFHILQTTRVFFKDGLVDMFNFKQPLSRGIWDKIANYIQKQGIKIVPYQKWTGVVAQLGVESGKINKIILTRPNASKHMQERGWKDHVLESSSSSRKLAFDYVISGIPAENFKYLTLNRTKKIVDLPSYSGISNLRSASTVSIIIESKHQVSKQFISTCTGLSNPLHTITDIKPFHDEYTKNDNIGSVLSIIGQPGEYSYLSDDEIVASTIKQVEKIKGVYPVKQWDIQRIEIHRNTARHERIFLGDPGVHQFRPSPQGYFKNLVMAGDWIKNGLDIVCMESAVRSGKKAANIVANQIRGSL